MSRPRRRALVVPPRLAAAATAALLLIGLAGCSRTVLRENERPTSRPVEGVGKGYFEPRVEAFVVPPRRWKLDPPKGDEQHTHLVWLSPDGGAAYGVIYLKIPGWVPTAIIPRQSLHNTVLAEFVKKMRQDQGEAELVSSGWDEAQDRLDFVAKGKTYTIHAFLDVRGHVGWSAYRGTLTGRDALPKEVALADKARDATEVGRDAGGAGSDTASAR